LFVVSEESMLGLWLLDQSFLMPWCVRARYILMAAILEHLTLKMVSIAIQNRSSAYYF